MLNYNISCINKVRYETKESAINAYNKYILCNTCRHGKKIHGKKVKQYPYKCDYCEGWHLTTKK